MFPWARIIYDSYKAAPKSDRDAVKICAMMEEAQHIEVEWDIWNYAADLAVEHSLSDRGHPGGTHAPDGARLFADMLVVTIPAERPVGHLNTICKMFYREGETILSLMLAPYGRHFPKIRKSYMLCSGYTPGKQGFVISDLHYVGASQEVMIQEALQDAFLMSVLNHDRFVRRSPAAGSRQARRSTERALGFAPAGWYRVTWNIGEDVKAKVADSDPDSARPLHFCRAHWRQAIEGQPKAIARNDAPGWWCWVKECWRGHPAFGIKLHHYTPKLRDEGSMNLRTKSKTA
jgi:hypothetical protein